MSTAARAARAFKGERTVALITGANRGLGFELARMMLRMGGYHVIAAARSWSKDAGSPYSLLRQAHQFAQEVPSRRSGSFTPVELEVTNPASRFALQNQMSAALGYEQKINVLVNNAGVYIDGWTADAFARNMAVNCTGAVALTRELTPLFAPGTRVVNVSSGLGALAAQPPAYRSALEGCKKVDDIAAAVVFDAAVAPTGSYPAYGVSKAALGRATALLAKEYKGYATVNAVDPGWCKTDMGGPKAPRSAEDGAMTLFHMLSSDESVVGSGHFYDSALKRREW